MKVISQSKEVRNGVAVRAEIVNDAGLTRHVQFEDGEYHWRRYNDEGKVIQHERYNKFLDSQVLDKPKKE